MERISSLRKLVAASLIGILFVGCTGTEIGLNELKAVNPTNPFATLEPSTQAANERDEIVNQLTQSYQQYRALYAQADKERPTAENTCYELTERVARVKPILKKQVSVLVATETSYNKLLGLSEQDSQVERAAETGKLHIAKARERIQKSDELLDITNSFSSDCPTDQEMFLHIMTGVTALGGIAQYENAKAKAPMFNKKVAELENLSAEEKELASTVVKSLTTLRSASVSGRL